MFKITKFFLLINLIIVLLPWQAVAQSYQEEYYTRKELKLQDGLPNQNINDIFFDSKGFAWISTFGGGIARYDGDSFIPFSTKTEPRIKNDYVHEACQDDNDRLWIAGARGLDIIDLKTLQLYNAPKEYQILSSNPYCSSICKDSEGSIWFFADNMLYRVAFEDEGNTFVIDSLQCSSDNDRIRQTIHNVDDDETVWFMLSGKLCKAKYVSEKGIRISEPFPMIDFGQDNRCTSIIRSSDDIWIGTLYGLYRINQFTSESRIYKHDDNNHSLFNDEISGLCIDDNGKIVVGTLGGVEIYEPQSDSFTDYSSRANTYGNKMLPGSMVRSIVSHRGQLWVGLEVEGLAIMQKKRIPVINCAYQDNEGNHIPATPARSMFVDSNDRLWVGATEYGVGMYTGDMTFKFFNSRNSNLKDDTINAFCEDGEGRLWMGSVEGNLNYININNPTIVNNPPFGNSETAKRIDVINRIVYDDINNSLWILATAGIFIYDLTESILTEYPEKLNLCMGAFIDSSSRMWLSHSGGLKMINLESMEVRDYPEVPSTMAFLPDDDGIWAGTFSNGLIHIELKPDKSLDLKVYNESDGLVDNRIRGLLKDGDKLWITTENGLSLFDTDAAKFESFGLSDGLRSAAFCEGSIARSASGTIFLGQKEGFSILQSSYVSNLGAEESNIVISGGLSRGSYLNLVYKEEEVKIKEHDGRFTLLFSDLSFSDTPDINYESRLLPNKDWTTIFGNSKFITYERIPGGSHKLQVRAVDKNGNVLSQDEIEMHVKPAFYKSWIFLVIIACVIFLLIQICIELKTKSIKKNKERLQEEVDRQTKLLQEQKLQIQRKVDELSNQNIILQKQVETLAGNKILISNDFANKDSKFMDDVMNAIQTLYKDPELDIYAFAEAVGMSRTMLNDKLQGAIGQSIAQFIKVYRLNVAKEMICNGLHTDMNVSDVAYEVGFNDPKYFTRCFTQQFGMAPSVLMNEYNRGK